jgi:hypothetical protein
MKSPVKFDSSVIATCGMNCGNCLAYLRVKNHCPGCRVSSIDNQVSCQNCIISNCIHLEKTNSKFCYECVKFPCTRMKQLDKRYRTRYNTSFIENLLMIKDNGIEEFLEFESARRTCPECGSVLCVHRQNCLNH